MTSPFEDVPADALVRFVAEYPLAWIIPNRAPADALLMPVLLDGPDLDTGTMLGHLPRRAPATQALQDDGCATLLFLGPNAYIPPSWISKPGWAPTWNFVSLKLSGTIGIDETLTEEAVVRLVSHMEDRAGTGWSVDRMGERFHTLLGGVIGFRMQIESVSPRFKTGQDESPSSQEEIFSALADHPLQAWMKRP